MAVGNCEVSEGGGKYKPAGSGDGHHALIGNTLYPGSACLYQRCHRWRCELVRSIKRPPDWSSSRTDPTPARRAMDGGIAGEPCQPIAFGIFREVQAACGR